jgi:transcriptional regulator with XRE-family HTH domain
MSQKTTLGPLIKQKRQDLGLTQRALAKELGVKASHVAYLETGKRKPSLTLMARLEGALGVSRQQIFLLAHPEAAAFVNSGNEGPTAPSQFVADRTFFKRHRVTRREIRAFKQLQHLGYVLSRHQVLAILTVIREPRED